MNEKSYERLGVPSIRSSNTKVDTPQVKENPIIPPKTLESHNTLIDRTQILGANGASMTVDETEPLFLRCNFTRIELAASAIPVINACITINQRESRIWKKAFSRERASTLRV